MAHIPSNARCELFQIQNGIGDQLTGAMKGDQTTTIGSMKIGAKLSQMLFIVDCIVLRSNSDRIHRLVLSQNEHVSKLLGCGVVKLRCNLFL